MAKFKDTQGQDWDLTLSVGMLGKLRQEAGFDLRAKDAGTQISNLDPYSEQFAQVLWVLVERQALERGLKPEDFVFHLDGPTIEQATQALTEAFIDFFPNARQRQTIRAKLPGILAQMEAEADARMDAELSKAFAGNWPASAASTPTA